MACYPNDCLLVLLVFSRFFGQPKAVGLSGCGFPAPAQIVISTSMAERGITTDDLSQQLHPFLAPTPARSINTEQQRMAKLLAAPQWGWRQSFARRKEPGCPLPREHKKPKSSFASWTRPSSAISGHKRRPSGPTWTRRQSWIFQCRPVSHLIALVKMFWNGATLRRFFLRQDVRNEQNASVAQKLVPWTCNEYKNVYFVFTSNIYLSNSSLFLQFWTMSRGQKQGPGRYCRTSLGFDDSRGQQRQRKRVTFTKFSGMITLAVED